jgi:hypothetical protein
VFGVIGVDGVLEVFGVFDLSIGGNLGAASWPIRTGMPQPGIMMLPSSCCLKSGNTRMALSSSAACRSMRPSWNLIVSIVVRTLIL